MAVVTPEARAAQALCAPIADKLQAQWVAWLLVHRLPGENVGSARRRFATLRSDEGLERIRAHARRKRALIAQERRRRMAGLGYVAIRDDGLDDAKWAALHPERAYRIRLHRSSDGEPALFQLPTMTVIHIATGARANGIPLDTLRVGRVIIAPHDSDEFCEALFWAWCETDGFRKPLPGSAA